MPAPHCPAGGRRAPHESAAAEAALQQKVLHDGGAECQGGERAGDEGDEARHVADQRRRELRYVLLRRRVTRAQPTALERILSR